MKNLFRKKGIIYAILQDKKLTFEFDIDDIWSFRKPEGMGGQN